MKEFHSDSSDYEYPDQYTTETWGNATHGLVMKKEEWGGSPWWTVVGVPPEWYVVGGTRLCSVLPSSTTLAIMGPTDWGDRVFLAFQQALAPWDILNEEEGPTKFALESALEQRTYERRRDPWSEQELAGPEKALAASDPDGPAGMALRFLVAVISLGLGRLERASELLAELERPGREIRFSQGFHVLYAEGQPTMLEWPRGDLLFPAPELRLARASWMIARGEKSQAKEALQEMLREAAGKNTPEFTLAQAEAMLAWLTKSDAAKA